MGLMQHVLKILIIISCRVANILLGELLPSHLIYKSRFLIDLKNIVQKLICQRSIKEQSIERIQLILSKVLWYD